MPDTPRYRVLHSLGKGGMGEVFLADDTQLGRKVAIKFLADGATNDGRALERLYREARSAAALDHPFICKIHEITEVEGRTGIVMEHVSGATLQAELARSPVSPKRAVEIAGEVAEALEEAHRKRVVHRDLKPANVMLTEQGHVKVMDFGLAKQVRVDSSDDQTTGSLTDPGTRVGTPGYMAPEQLLGSDADERSDIFAFGILLYELLAGVHPFRRSSPSGTMAAILREPHAPVGQYAKDASDTARVTLDRLLAKDPGDRYQSFGALRTDLGQLLRDATGLTPFPQADATAATTTDGRTPFVGRESERAEARRLLERAVSGQGGVLLLGGEPGVGKTRLAEEILLEARQRGCLALAGRCYEMEGTPPFIPWVEIVERSSRIVPRAALQESLGDAGPEVAKLVPELRQLFPDMPPALELPPDQQQRYLFSNFLSFVDRAARVTPQVMLIDDLHWADESTLLLLQHLAQHAAHMPLLLVGTYRDVDLEVARPFAKTLEAFTRQRLAHRIALHRLELDGVSQMLEAMSGLPAPDSWVSAIHAETEGNPFFIEEVFQHLLEEDRLLDRHGEWRNDLQVDRFDVPEGVRLVIGRRVERLSEEARRALTTAAVVGRSFDLVLLEAVGDSTGDALLTAFEEAEAARLVTATSSRRETRWEFSHGLIRQALASSLSLPRRQRVHLRVAEAMEKLHGGNASRHAADIGHHLYQAGAAADPDKAVHFLALAGDHALETGAFDEARRLFNNALEVVLEDDRATRGTMLRKRGSAEQCVGRWDEAIEEWKKALAIYHDLQDYDAMAQVCWDLGRLMVWQARGREFVSLARPVMEALSDEASADRCRLLANSGWALVHAAETADDAATGDDLVVKSLEMAETLGDPRAIRDVLLRRAYQAFLVCDAAELADAGLRAATLLRSSGDLWNAADALSLYQTGSVFLGRLDGVAEYEHETEDLAKRLANDAAEWFASWARLGRDWFTLGDLSHLEVSVQHFRDVTVRTGMPWLMVPDSFSALARVWGGHWDLALEGARASNPGPRGSAFGISWSTLFLCECLIGHRETALRMFGERPRGLPQPGRPNTAGAWLMLNGIIEGMAVLGERKVAADLYPLALEEIKTSSVVSMTMSHLVETIAAIAAAAGRHWTSAEEHFETALKQAHEIPFRSEQPEARRWYAQMLLDRNASGDRDKAKTLLGEATEMYRSIGMPKHLEMVEKMSAGL